MEALLKMSERTTSYILIISGIMLLFYFTGLSKDAGTLLSTLLSPQNFNTSAWWVAFIGVLGGTLISTIVVGIFTQNIELAVMAPLSAFLLIALYDFIKIYVLLASLNYVLATLFFAPFLILLPLTIVDYWLGRD